MKNRRKLTTVGIIGLGNMGSGIASALFKANYKCMVWDINKSTIKNFSHVFEVTEPKNMAPKCNVIFFVVPGSNEVNAIIKGKNGVLANAKRGLVLCDLTTSDPVATIKLARKAKLKGVGYLDAGMTGGAAGADAGRLKLMIGGDKAVFKRVKPILDAFTTDLYHLGSNGAGHTMKLIFNMVVHTNFLVVCEAALMAEKAGISLPNMIEVINAGNAKNYASEHRFPDHILSKTWDARSRIFNLNKDVKMAVSLGKKFGLNLKIGTGTLAYLNNAINREMGEKDFSLLYKEFRSLIKS